MENPAKVSGIEPKTCKVALLAGGKSGEREISLKSGEGVKRALESQGFPVVSLDPASKIDLKRLIDEDFDVAFICLHGKWGEDGTIQGFLEMLEIPYVGSGVLSSSVSMDKSKTKVFYDLAGIKTPKSIDVFENSEDTIKKILDEIGLPCVIKPATEGSALGVYIIKDESQLNAALEGALELDSTVLAEQYVEGKELTAAVLGNKELRTLPVVEIIPSNEFYDFESKYAPGGSQHICPAPLSEEESACVRESALKAHEVLDCRGVSRSDFILDKEGRVWILETNSIPGMTSTSLLPDAGKAEGISYEELCVMLIQYALEEGKE